MGAHSATLTLASNDLQVWGGVRAAALSFDDSASVVASGAASVPKELRLTGNLFAASTAAPAAWSAGPDTPQSGCDILVAHPDTTLGVDANTFRFATTAAAAGGAGGAANMTVTTTSSHRPLFTQNRFDATAAASSTAPLLTIVALSSEPAIEANIFDSAAQAPVVAFAAARVRFRHNYFTADITDVSVSGLIAVAGLGVGAGDEVGGSGGGGGVVDATGVRAIAFDFFADRFARYRGPTIPYSYAAAVPDADYPVVVRSLAASGGGVVGATQQQRAFSAAFDCCVLAHYTPLTLARVANSFALQHSSLAVGCSTTTTTLAPVPSASLPPDVTAGRMPNPTVVGRNAAPALMAAGSVGGVVVALLIALGLAVVLPS